MPCEHSPYATSGPANYCANYDWGPKHTQKYNDPSEISPYGYAYRNCTDYVAWRLASLGVPTSIYKGHGNGSGWASVSGLTTNTTPAVGAVAVQTSGTFGHVAFITGVSGSTITIAEYNYGENGTYDTRSGTLSGLGFNKVTHFEKYESGGGQGSGEEVVPVTTSDGHVQIFYDSNGTLGENWYSPGNGSSGGGTLNPGIQVEGNPTLVPRSGQSVIDAFIRGTNGQIFETWYNWGNGVWGGWIPIGGNTFTGDPEAVATSDGHDQVFADANGTLEENWFSPGNGAVGGWVLV
jgi:surface antigen